MSIDTRLLLLFRRATTRTALLALVMLLALGCGGDRRGGGGDDDDNNDDSADDDDTSSDDDDDDDTGSDDDDDTGSGDDDTGSGDDDTGSGTGVPSVESVDVCEQPNPAPGSPPCSTPDFYAQFTVFVTDSDGDLQNPTVYLSVAGQSPQPQALEGDLGAGGGFALQVCSTWPRGTDIPYSVSIQDAAGNESQPFPGTWAVPASTGQDDCPQ